MIRVCECGDTYVCVHVCMCMHVVISVRLYYIH